MSNFTSRDSKNRHLELLIRSKEQDLKATEYSDSSEYSLVLSCAIE